MGKLAELRKWLPVAWVGLSAIILCADYLTGPFISLSILFVIPVALASRMSGARWGISLAACLPLVHFGFTLVWQAPWSLMDSAINAGLRIAVLATFAFLIARTTRQAREIRVLRGLLPVCGFCKKIRTDNQLWLPIERYITERSEASFTHTFCPECGKQHYGEFFDKLQAVRSSASNDAPPQPHST